MASPAPGRIDGGGTSDPVPVVAVRQQSVEVSWRTVWDLVMIETADGRTGLGEWSDATPQATGNPTVDPVGQLLIGMTVDQALDEVSRRVAELGDTPTPQRRLNATVLGGLDSALCDLAAQAHRVSLATWLHGGVGRPDDAVSRPPTIGLYANINRAIRHRTPEEFATQASAAVAAGFTTIKCAPWDQLAGPQRVHDGLRLAAAVRDAVGDEVELLLDLHGHLQVAEIVAAADELRSLRPGWIEEVAALHDLAGLRTVRDATGLPIADGEFCVTEAEIAPALDAGLLNIVMPDVKHAAGPRQALRLTRSALAAGVRISPHNPCGPVATAHTAAICAGLPDALLEFPYGEDFDRTGLLDPPEHVRDGRLTVIDRVGLGHQFNQPH